MRFGFIAALEAEARAFPRPRGVLLRDHEYRIALAGPGRERAARAANQFVLDGCDVLVSFGVAGALARKYGPGDLVLSTNAMTSTGEALDFDRTALQPLADALSSLNPQVGTILTVAEAVTGVREKSFLRERLGADAVDLESSGIAYVARSAGRHFVAVRSIVDDAHFEVPETALAGLDDNGRLRLLRTLAALAEHPADLPRMLRLASHFRRAVRTLHASSRLLID